MATLRKGLASCLTIGSKKKETKEKKNVCKSIVESHQDGAINNRRDVTCRPHRGRVTGPVGEASLWYVPEWGPAATQPLR